MEQQTACLTKQNSSLCMLTQNDIEFPADSQCIKQPTCNIPRRLITNTDKKQQKLT